MSEHVGFIINLGNVFELTLEGVSVFKSMREFKFYFKGQPLRDSEGNMYGFDFAKEESKIIWNHAEANRILIAPNAPINTSVFETLEICEEK